MPPAYSNRHERTNQIVTSALSQGADVMAVSCPLCAFNLDHRQKETAQKYPDFRGLPVLYFTQLMGLAFGIPAEQLGLHRHFVAAEEFLSPASA